MMLRRGRPGFLLPLEGDGGGWRNARRRRRGTQSALTRCLSDRLFAHGGDGGGVGRTALVAVPYVRVFMVVNVKREEFLYHLPYPK